MRWTPTTIAITLIVGSLLGGWILALLVPRAKKAVETVGFVACGIGLFMLFGLYVIEPVDRLLEEDDDTPARQYDPSYYEDMGPDCGHPCF